MYKRLIGVTLLLVLVSNLCWAQYRFSGTFYPLRWGQAEGNQDLVTPVNALGNPLCVKMGTGWSAYLDGVSNLLGWMDEWNAGRWTDGNCVDVSLFTMIALCSLGMDFSARVLATNSLLPPSPDCGRESHPENPWHCTNTSSSHFHTNMVCPIGSDPTPGDDPGEPTPPYPDYTYRWYSWAWHQVCVLSDAADMGAGVWDATAAQKLDLFGSSYRNPPAHHPARWWIQEDYWQIPRMWGASLGLVNEPGQIAGGEPVAVWTGKCGVSTLPWEPY